MARIPGLNTGLNEETLATATRLYNEYPLDTNFPKISVLSDGFKELCATIAYHNLHTCFRLRLLHRHRSLTDGQVLLGSSMARPRGYWIQPTAIRNIDTSKIHGNIFSATRCPGVTRDKGLVLSAVEFCEGPVIFKEINNSFITEFVHCLERYGLEGVLGLEAKGGEVERMTEFSFDNGSLLVRGEELSTDFVKEHRRVAVQETGWVITIQDKVVDSTGETRCVTYDDGHRKWTNSKLNSGLDAVAFLREKKFLTGADELVAG